MMNHENVSVPYEFDIGYNEAEDIYIGYCPTFRIASQGHSRMSAEVALIDAVGGALQVAADSGCLQIAGKPESDLDYKRLFTDTKYLEQVVGDWMGKGGPTTSEMEEANRSV